MSRQRIDYCDSPETPRANSLVPSAPWSSSKREGGIRGLGARAERSALRLEVTIVGGAFHGALVVRKVAVCVAYSEVSSKCVALALPSA
jgi:hypothetical protein